MSRVLLHVNELEAGYGKKPVLFGISMKVMPEEIVALIGPNGSGKSTVLKAICGLLPAWSGEITFNGASINSRFPASNMRQGISYVPQYSKVFAEMTVMENLELGGILLPPKITEDRVAYVLDIFPMLKKYIKQKAGLLSGGEQQMVALARSLIVQPKLLMLDEPSLGLSPNLVIAFFEKIVEISLDQKISVLIVEQKVAEVLAVAARVYSFKLGRVVFVGSSDELKCDDNKLRSLFL